MFPSVGGTPAATNSSSHGSSGTFSARHLFKRKKNVKSVLTYKKQKPTKTDVYKHECIRKEEDNTIKNERNRRTSDSLKRRALL
jgi:hypothetical protein